MGKYLEWMGAAGIEVYVILGIFILSMSAGVIMGIIRAKRQGIKANFPLASVKAEGVPEPTKTEQLNKVLGTGHYKCMCFRPNNIIDFTTMPKPLGEIYQFEPSCPISGAGYIVKETEDGELKDYDPREVEVVVERTPEYAWFATHWDIVTKNFWTVAVQWWKSPATWFAVMMMGIVFICGLVVFD